MSSYDLPPATSAPLNAVLPKNPSYPPRVHVSKRAELEELLRQWDDRIAEARKKLEVIGNGPDRPRYERMYAQMLGARDQLAESVRRMPMEAGWLYEESEHRLHQAVAALERIFAKWN